MSFFGIFVLNSVKERENKPLYFTPPNVLRHFSLGYKDFVADLLWLRFIQTADFCSFEQGKPTYKGRVQTCEFGWAYKMVDAITELAPHFKAPYTISSLILSVFSGDIKGAEKILLKGLKYFPNDWRLNYYAVYIYSVELQKPLLAAPFAYRAAENGGPYWLYSLSAKQYSSADYYYLGESILKNLLKRNFSSEQKQYIHKQLENLKKKYQ